MDEKLRKLEREARAKNDAELLAQLIESERRTGDEDAIITTISNFTEDVRRTALRNTSIEPQNQALLNVMAYVRCQTPCALQTAALYDIKPEQGDGAFPTDEEIYESIKAVLSTGQAEQILHFQKPTLVIFPVTSARRHSEALNSPSCRKIFNQQISDFEEYTANVLDHQATSAGVGSNEIIEWGFSLTEGAQTFERPEWDNAYSDYRERDCIEWCRERNMSRLSVAAYISLMMQGLQKGEPIDCRYLEDSNKADAKYIHQVTFLEHEQYDGGFRVGEWYPGTRRVRIFLSTRRIDTEAHYRLAVTGRIIKKS